MEEERSGEDVHVEIKDLEKVMYGESYNGMITAKVSHSYLTKLSRNISIVSIYLSINGIDTYLHFLYSRIILMMFEQ